MSFILVPGKSYSLLLLMQSLAYCCKSYLDFKVSVFEVIVPIININFYRSSIIERFIKGS